MALDRGLKPVEAMAETLKRLEGAFALAVLFAGEDDLLVAARRGSPLAVGHGDGEMFLGSDAIALAPFTHAITYLEDGDWAVVTRRSVQIFNDEGKRVERPIVHAVAASLTVDKGNHRHFMLKEIYEQPEVISHTLAPLRRLHHRPRARCPKDAPVDFSRPRPADDVGLRHRAAMPASSANTGSRGSPGCRSTSISPRSSATARCRSTRTGWRSSSRSRARPPTRSPRSAIAPPPARRSAPSSTCRPRPSRARRTIVLPTLAGPEIGVASTKAFTCQLTVLFALAVAAARQRGAISAAEEERLVDAAIEVPRHAAHALKLEPRDRGARQGAREGLRRALSRPRHVLSAGARRRAEAQGDLLHPRRRLCRRRAEARADRADRRDACRSS